MSESIGGSSSSAGASAAPASSTPSQSAGTTTPSQGASPVASSTPATEQQPGQQGTTPVQNEPPRERWDSILENTRKKTRAEVEAEYRTKYGKYDAFEQDPWTAVQGWLDRAQQHSLYGPMVQQWMQQRMQQSRGPEPVGEEPRPDVPIVDAQGNITGYTYGEQRLKEWHKWSQKQLQAEYDKRIAPLEQAQRQQQHEREMARIERDAHQSASQTLAQLEAQPYFKEHKADIAQALEDHPEWEANVHAAYNHVLVTKILPTLSQAEQQRVVDSINQKAGATTVSPRGTAAGVPQFKSFRTAARYFEEHPEEAADYANRR